MPIETMMEGVARRPASQSEATEESASLPLSIMGGKEVEVGDVVRLTVTAVDNETISVNYAEEAPAAAPEKEGIEGLATAFD